MGRCLCTDKWLLFDRREAVGREKHMSDPAENSDSDESFVYEGVATSASVSSALHDAPASASQGFLDPDTGAPVYHFEASEQTVESYDDTSDQAIIKTEEIANMDEVHNSDAMKSAFSLENLYDGP